MNYGKSIFILLLLVFVPVPIFLIGGAMWAMILGVGVVIAIVVVVIEKVQKKNKHKKIYEQYLIELKDIPNSKLDVYEAMREFERSLYMNDGKWEVKELYWEACKVESERREKNNIIIKTNEERKEDIKNNIKRAYCPIEKLKVAIKSDNNNSEFYPKSLDSRLYTEERYKTNNGIANKLYKLFKYNETPILVTDISRIYNQIFNTTVISQKISAICRQLCTQGIIQREIIDENIITYKLTNE